MHMFYYMSLATKDACVSTYYLPSTLTVSTLKVMVEVLPVQSSPSS